MNEYQVRVYFASGRMSYNIGTLIKGDYNSSKLVFTFDDDTGIKMFELLKPDGITKWVKEIVNNEIVLADTDELGETIPLLTQEGTYIFEVAKYDGNSKLTSVKGKFKVKDEQVSTSDIPLEEVSKVELDDLINDVAKVVKEAAEATANTVEQANYAKEQGDYAKEQAQVITKCNQEATNIINDFKNNVDEYTEDFNTNAIEKTEIYNQNDVDKTTVYNQNAESKENSYNENAATKLKTYNDNALLKEAGYNANAESKITEFNINANAKVEEYNTNANNKLEEYNINAETKVNEFNSNIDNLKQDLEDCYNNMLTAEAEGSYIHVEDSANAKIKEISINGVCEQETTSGKNILQLTTDKETYNYQNTHTIEDNIFIGIPSSSWAQTRYKIYIKPNTQYTFSSKISLEGTNLPSVWHITIKNEDETNIFSNSVNIVNSKISYSFNSGENNFILISFWSRTGENSVGVTKTIYSEIQLEEGLTANNYEPYTGGLPSPSPSFPQPISAIENRLKITSNNGELEDSENYLFSQIEINILEGEFIGKVDDTHKDILKIENGHAILTKKILKKVLNGTENWIKTSTTFAISGAGYLKNNMGAVWMNTHFGQTPNKNNCLWIGNSSFINVRYDDMSTLEDFKAFLAEQYTNGTAVEVYYLVDEPYEADLGKVNMPQTYEGITNISLICNLESNIKVKYVQSTNIVVDNLAKAIVALGGEV